MYLESMSTSDFLLIGKSIEFDVRLEFSGDVHHINNEEEVEDKTSKSDHQVLEANNDGFQTPTSLQHKIVIQQCPPPPPKKPKSLPSKKRKSPSSSSSSSNIHRVCCIDVSKEIEMLFPQPFLHDLGRKMKKAKGYHKMKM